MKTLLCIALSLFSLVAFGEDDMRNVRTVGLREITANMGGFSGQVVKVRFGWREGEMLAARDKNLTGKIHVVVPEEGKQWFERLSVQPTSTSALTAYVRVVNGYPGCQLLGREYRDGAFVW